MSVLFDTNILLRAAQPGHPQHQQALKAGDVLKDRGETLCVAAQVLCEFWAVATRPEGENGLGLTTTDALAELARIKRLFRVLPDNETILPLWEQLVGTHGVKGRSTYDARLVACMKAHNVTHILTFNAPDFARYSGITVLSPQTVVQPA